MLVAVGNTPAYGGGMKMCPAADPTDGLLDVVVAGPISRLTLLRLQPKVYQGTHVDHPAVTSHRARTVGIDAEGITAYADGERTCPLPITITARPGMQRRASSVATGSACLTAGLGHGRPFQTEYGR